MENDMASKTRTNMRTKAKTKAGKKGTEEARTKRLFREESGSEAIDEREGEGESEANAEVGLIEQNCYVQVCQLLFSTSGCPRAQMGLARRQEGRVPTAADRLNEPEHTP